MITQADIAKLAKLEPNWDGYGGLPINTATIEHADLIVSALRSVGVLTDVTPNPNGTISFEWQLGETNTGHIEVGATRGVGYVKG